MLAERDQLGLRGCPACNQTFVQANYMIYLMVSLQRGAKSLVNIFVNEKEKNRAKWRQRAQPTLCLYFDVEI